MTYSHGFRKGRGALTLFAHVESWGKIDRLIKADIVSCEDNIDHALLNSTIGLHIGQGNDAFCNIIAAFLRTEIRDKEGKEYGSCVKGIPQGWSTISCTNEYLLTPTIYSNQNFFRKIKTSIRLRQIC